jgi:DNA-binding transcriptional MerR regulator
VHAEEIAEMTDQYSQRWYTTEELAELLKIDPSSVRRWRTAEPLQGPPFIRVSARRTIYNAADVAAWLDQRRIDPSAVA